MTSSDVYPLPYPGITKKPATEKKGVSCGSQTPVSLESGNQGVIKPAHRRVLVWLIFSLRELYVMIAYCSSHNSTFPPPS